MRIIKSKRGETLVESLISILVIALASSMFLSYVVVSGRIMAKARTEKENYYKETSFLEALETDGSSEELVKMSSDGTLTVSVKREDSGYRKVGEFPVTVYYSDDMAAYQLEAE